MPRHVLARPAWPGSSGRPLSARPITLLAAIALLIAACGGSSDQAASTTDDDAVASAPAATEEPVEVPTTAAVEPVTQAPETDPAATDQAEAETPTAVATDAEQADDDADDTDDDAATGVGAGDPNPACLGRDVAFSLYADSLNITCDDEFMYVESDNLADHEMMVGITAWNEQVPLPQLFVGSNSWSIPLSPAFNDTTTPTTGQGPVAVAINGVMIFNPTQQSGVYSLQTDPNLIGELDACGGHAGRGDDYHYHVSPVCLEADHIALDADFDGIVAYAMDGYAIYANTAIPEGAELDECGGLGSSAEDYRYFATEEFPYVNGCFRGDFDMNLQPQAPSIRPAGTPIQAEITSLFEDDAGWSHLEYVANGVTGSINWIESSDDCFDFEFIDDISSGTVRLAETYCRSDQQGAAPADAADNEPPPQPEDGQGEDPPPQPEDGQGEGPPPQPDDGQGEGPPPRPDEGQGEGPPPRPDE